MTNIEAEEYYNRIIEYIEHNGWIETDIILSFTSGYLECLLALYEITYEEKEEIYNKIFQKYVDDDWSE